MYYQGKTIRSHDPKMCTCNHAVTRNSFGTNLSIKLTVFVYSSLIWFHHDRIEIDTSISVIVVSLTTWEAHHSLRALWASQVVNETTMTSILVSIPVTHYGLVMPYADRELGHYWLRECFVA